MDNLLYIYIYRVQLYQTPRFSSLNKHHLDNGSIRSCKDVAGSIIWLPNIRSFSEPRPFFGTRGLLFFPCGRTRLPRSSGQIAGEHGCLLAGLGSQAKDMIGEMGSKGKLKSFQSTPPVMAWTGNRGVKELKDTVSQA